MSTFYGLDVSHYQSPGLDLDADHLKGQGYAFVMAKATEGATFRDSAYHAYRDQAQKAGLMFAAYHFLKHGDIAAQVANLVGYVSDASIPIMLDVEAYGATLGDAQAFRAEAAKHGRHVSLLYLPHWYWQRIGSPSLRGWSVVASSYPSSAHQLGSALYPGKGGSGWGAYGGVHPVIWQFASSGKVDGYGGNVDLDAFEGKRSKLASYFKDYAPAKPAKAKPAKPKRTPAKHAKGHETRLQRFWRRYHEHRGIVRVHILDAAVKNGRVGTVKEVRDEIERQMERLPKNGPRMQRVHRAWQQHRNVRMDVLYRSIHDGGRVGTVRNVRRAIKRAVRRLPKS